MDYNLRIGIHSGEVIFEENDVFGDGVNIASRMQALAIPGSILISETVYNNIENKKDIRNQFAGQETLKNVKEPVEIYEVIMTCTSRTNQSTVKEPSQIIAGKKYCRFSFCKYEQRSGTGIFQRWNGGRNSNSLVTFKRFKSCWPYFFFSV